jgi:hypothetical protein
VDSVAPSAVVSPSAAAGRSPDDAKAAGRAERLRRQRWFERVAVGSLHGAPAATLDSTVSVWIDSWFLNSRQFEFLDRLPALEAIWLGDDGSGVTVFPGSPPDLLAPVPVTPGQLAHLAGHEHLEFLVLQRIRLDGDGIAAITALGSVRFLTLNLCELPGGAVATIARARSSLEGLDLTGTPIDADSLAALCSLRRLKRLSMRWTGASPPAIRRLRDALPDATITADDQPIRY